MKPLSRRPLEPAAVKIEDSFYRCTQRIGSAFWRSQRWWIEDDGKRVWAVDDVTPGCAGSNLQFKRTQNELRAARRKRRK